MRIPSLAAFAFFTLFQVSLLDAQNVLTGIYEYQWVGGQPGFSGQLFLDAPSSASAPHGGTDADLLPGSFVSTPLGTFSVLDKGLDASFGAAGAMSWDASQISLMWLFFQPTTTIINPGYGLPAIGSAQTGEAGVGNAIEVGSLVGGFGTVYAYDDFTGHWAAVPVPEPSAMSLILLGAAAALARCGMRDASIKNVKLKTA
jgi:hypothetical protein